MAPVNKKSTKAKINKKSTNAPIKNKIKSEKFLSVQVTKKEDKQYRRKNDAIAAGGCIRIDNLPFGFVTSNMKHYFSQYGKLLDARIPINPRNGKSKSTGYVLFDDGHVAKIAADTNNNYMVCGSLLKCTIVDNSEVKMKVFDPSDKMLHARNNATLVKINAANKVESIRNKNERLMEAVIALEALDKLIPGVLTTRDLGLDDNMIGKAKKFAVEENEKAKAAEEQKKADEKSLKAVRKLKAKLPTLPRPKRNNIYKKNIPNKNGISKKNGVSKKNGISKAKNNIAKVTNNSPKKTKDSSKVTKQLTKKKVVNKKKVVK